MNKDLIVLGIESSCDDTSAAILKGSKVLSNIVANQSIHEKYGGVVPELASQEHLNEIISVIEACLEESKLKIKQIPHVTEEDFEGEWHQRQKHSHVPQQHTIERAYGKSNVVRRAPRAHVFTVSQLAPPVLLAAQTPPHSEKVTLTNKAAGEGHSDQQESARLQRITSHDKAVRLVWTGRSLLRLTDERSTN